MARRQRTISTQAPSRSPESRRPVCNVGTAALRRLERVIMELFIAGFLNGVIIVGVILLIAYNVIYRPVGRRRRNG